MFNVCRKLGALLIIVIVIMSTLSGCKKEPEYTAECDFSYSSDKGHVYGNGLKEYAVGDTIYMKVRYRVESNQKKKSQVKVKLTIPNVKNADAKYMDGQVITPSYDSAKNITTYEFTANASKDAPVSECVFQFVPNTAGSITMKLVFDDKVDSSYDKQNTLNFVEQ